jgi:hypothetical protein
MFGNKKKKTTNGHPRKDTEINRRSEIDNLTFNSHASIDALPKYPQYTNIIARGDGE